MSNKDICIKIINEFEDEQLKSVAILLNSIKHMVAEASDNAYCLELANDYENDLSSDKDETMSIENFSKEPGIELE